MTCDSLWNCLAAPLAFGFMQRGMLAALLIGIVCAVIGAFVVLQELAFIGDALAHASFPGVVIAFLLKFPLELGGAIVGILTALGIGVITRRTRVSQDTAIGVLFAGTFALGVALLSTVKNYTKDLFGLLRAVARADGGHDRDRHPDGRDCAGRGDAGHAGRDRDIAGAAFPTGNAGRRDPGRRRRGRRAVPVVLPQRRFGRDDRAVADEHVRPRADPLAAPW